MRGFDGPVLPYLQPSIVMWRGCAAMRSSHRADRRIRVERKATFVGDVRVAVQRDVGDGEALANEIVEVRQVRFHQPQRGMAAGLFAFVFGAPRFRQSEIQRDEAGGRDVTARDCTARRTATAGTSARIHGSSGSSAVPFARKFSIAFDSARWRPSGNSSSGMRPFGLRARNAGVRDSPFMMSTCCHSCGMSRWFSSSLIL